MNLENYLDTNAANEPDYLKIIERRTWTQQLNPRMLSGKLQGRFLSMLSSMIQPGSILEIGTYTGYSALCLAEHLTPKGMLHTIEIDDELEDTIRENFALSPFESKIKLHIGDALKIIDTLEVIFDLVFIDADKRDYLTYYQKVFPKVRMGGYILVDNTLWDGKVLHPEKNTDIQTAEIMKFNDFIVNDPRVSNLIVPLRDGLTIIRKIKD
jgi:predicted O-methyltransferase YrrM